MKQTVLGLLALLGTILSANSYAQITLPFKYVVGSVTSEDLGSLGGGGASAVDINDFGHVVGRSRNASGVGQAFLHRNGVMQNVGSASNLQASYGWGINDLGEVVGQYHDPDVDQAKPFFWKQGLGRVTLSRSVHPGEPFSNQYIGSARAINNSGQITGRVYAPGAAVPNDIPYDVCYEEVPVLWPNRTILPQILYCADPIPVTHVGSAINNSGWIVGTEYGIDWKGFVWKNGVTTFIPMPVGGVGNLAALGINDDGIIVGQAGNGTGDRAFMWDGVHATSTWLGALPGGVSSTAYDVNDDRFVAGSSETLVPSGNFYLTRERAFIYHRNFGMYALPVPAGFPATSTNCWANALNNRASTGLVQVVGSCKSTAGGTQYHAIRWNVIVNKQPLFPSLP